MSKTKRQLLRHWTTRIGPFIGSLFCVVTATTCGQTGSKELVEELAVARATTEPATGPTPLVIYVTPLATATQVAATATATPTPTPTSVPEPDSDAAVVITTPTPEPTVAGSTATPTPAPIAQIWTASAANRFIVGYSSTGARLKVFDFSNVISSGGFTALKFLDESNLIAFADPGTAGEKLIKINIETDDVDTSWYSDVNLANTTVNSLVKFGTNRLLIPKVGTGTTIEAVGYNLTNNIAVRVGAPWYTYATCGGTTKQYVFKAVVSSITDLIWMNSGVTSTVNTIRNLDSVPVCTVAPTANSYSVVTGYPTGAAYVPLGGTQMPDGKVYIRFNHATTPVVAKYDFDGNIISNGAALFSDASVLGTNVGSRELVPLDSTTMIGAEWNSDTIFSISTSGSLNGILIRDGYSIDVSSIAVRGQD